jgi:hypothetical protein
VDDDLPAAALEPSEGVAPESPDASGESELAPPEGDGAEDDGDPPGDGAEDDGDPPGDETE